MPSPSRCFGALSSVSSKTPEDPNEAGDEECMIFSEDGTRRLLFIEVPDAKQVKNRVHLDLKPAEGTRDRNSIDCWGWEPAKSPTDAGRTGRDGWSLPIPRATNSAFCAVMPSDRDKEGAPETALERNLLRDNYPT